MDRVTPSPAPRGNSARMGVAPRSEAMEKYEMEAVVKMMMESWWNRRVPTGRYQDEFKSARLRIQCGRMAHPVCQKEEDEVGEQHYGEDSP